MINKHASNYNRISSFDELEREKDHIRKLLQKQGNTLEKDWNEIYSFWSFVPKTARFAKNFIGNLPMNLNIVSFILDIFSKKTAKKKKSTTLNVMGFLLDLLLNRKKKK